MKSEGIIIIIIITHPINAETFHTKPHGGARRKAGGGWGGHQVSRIHPLGTMNVRATFHSNSSYSC